MGWKWLGIGLAGKVSDAACVCANGFWFMSNVKVKVL